jgi:hypothetical protein
MIDWLKFGEPEQICIRKYHDEVFLDYEFRCFVCNGQITCISQYDHYTYYPYLFPIQNDLLVGMYLLWKSIHPFVNEVDSSYVIDIAYLKPSNKFMLVELSPFTPCTGPALFHWQQDKTVLQYGKKGTDSNMMTENTSEAASDTPFTTSDPSLLVGLSPSDLTALRNIEFRLKLEKDVHPQLGMYSGYIVMMSYFLFLHTFPTSICIDSMCFLSSGELVEVNWDMRWREEKTPYHEYFERAQTDRAESEKILTQQQLQSGKEDASSRSQQGGGWIDRARRWFGGGCTGGSGGGGGGGGEIEGESGPGSPAAGILDR